MGRCRGQIKRQDWVPQALIAIGGSTRDSSSALVQLLWGPGLQPGQRGAFRWAWLSLGVEGGAPEL